MFLYLFNNLKNTRTRTEQQHISPSPSFIHSLIKRMFSSSGDARRSVSFESDLERLLREEEDEDIEEEEREEEREVSGARETKLTSPIIKGQFRRLIPRKKSLFAASDVDDRRQEEQEEEEEEEEEGRRREMWESLDYAKIDSMWSRLNFKKTKTGVLTLERWSNSTFIGVIVGSVAFALMRLIDILYMWRVDTVLSNAPYSFVVRAVLFCVMSAFFAFSSALVTLIEPTAAGAGVSYVVAELNGVSSPKAISLKSGIVKTIGTIFSVSSGIAVGPEGPLVHVGSIIGSAFARGGSGRRQWRVMGDSDFRDIVSAGAAAGLASAFGAPIGGVLFSSEEASSFWSHDTTKRALLCSTLAVFVLTTLNGSIGKPFGLLHLDFAEEEKHWELFELGAFLLLGILSGILGAIITVVVSKLARYRRNSKIGRVGEAASVALMIALAQILLSMLLGGCVQYDDDSVSTRKTFPTSIGVALSCKTKNSYNDLASLLIGSREYNLKYLLSGRAKDATPVLTLIYSFVFQIIAIVFSAECALPAGLFLPTLTWGAAMGNIFCKLSETLLKRKLSAGAYALVGATSALAGVFRGSISLVVIILEGTGQLNFLLPLLLCVFFANKFASFIGPSFYESQLERSGIPYLHAAPPEEACVNAETEATLTASDICAAPAITFREIERVSNIEEILKTTTHNGFPIIKDVGNDEKRLIGLILRSQLLTLLSRRAFIENIIFYEQECDHESAMSSQALRSSSSKLDISTSSDVPSELRFKSSQQREAFENLEIAMRTFHQRKLFTERSALGGVKYIESIGLSENERNSHVILSDFMMLAPISVPERSSFERVWEIFRQLGLRHLCVVDSKNNIKGMITRENLYKLQHPEVS